MTVRSPLLLLSIAVPSIALLATAQPGASRAGKAPAATSRDAALKREIAPLVRQYCGGCHAGANPAGGLALTKYADVKSVLAARDVWERVRQNVAAGHMPPAGAPQPTRDQRTKLTAWIDSTLTGAVCDVRDPGRVTLRRLNREEYNNTVRDLLGVSVRPADDFPSDDVGYGFDNIGDVLSISPLLMEKYLTAAERVAEAAIVLPNAAAKTTRYPAARLTSTAGGLPQENGARILATEGAVYLEQEYAKEGDYVVRFSVSAQQAGPEPARTALNLDGRELKRFDVTVEDPVTQAFEVPVRIPAGKHRLAVAFVNDYYNPNASDKAHVDRNLIVQDLALSGPLGGKPDLPASHRRLITRMPSGPGAAERHACAREILAPFLRRAYRRPVAPEQVEKLVRVVDMAAEQGESFERGIQLAVETALVSPRFLFLLEPDPAGAKPGKPRALNDYELASRLSYFLWSSMPDDELLGLAARGRLRDPAALAAQVRRMLRDPKARALADNFAGQWLQLRNLANVAPNPDQFPTFNASLRDDMRTETLDFFEAIVHEDRSVLDFLDGRYTYLNERLARHYGISGVQGDGFRRVALLDGHRGGVLTQASVLTVTSNPTRTSPVKRGKWVLENLLGTPPPPAPPNVPALDNQAQLTGTLRQRMEQHRKNPACASCHARMDPLGFGLENFDAVGGWRSQDGKQPIDASGVLPDGRKFEGPTQLRAILMAQKGQFVHCLSEKLLTYALGRGLEYYDRCALDGIAKTAARGGYRFSALIGAIVQSEPFRMRKAEGGSRS